MYINRLWLKIKYKVQNCFEIDYYKKLNIRYYNEHEQSCYIKNCLHDSIPSCIGKIGGNELNSVASRYIKDSKFKKMTFERLCHYAGFFPKEYNEEYYDKYIDEQIKAISALDLIIKFPKKYEQYVLKKHKGMNLKCIDAVGSWQQDIPWTRELAGYRVVVVHPFAGMIEQQYRRREEIYPNSDVLPEFELRVVEAVQTIAESSDSRFATWFDALDYMFQEIMKEDFDIALIGCGAYGLPLAAKVKEAGKIGVHMGGDLQMLFGIRGKRWDDREKAKRWYNDAWVRPGEEYKPEGFDSIEEGCYW